MPKIQIYYPGNSVPTIIETKTIQEADGAVGLFVNNNSLEICPLDFDRAKAIKVERIDQDHSIFMYGYFVKKD